RDVGGVMAGRRTVARGVGWVVVVGWRGAVRVDRGRSGRPRHVFLRLRRGGAERQRAQDECRGETELAHRTIHGEFSCYLVLVEHLGPTKRGHRKWVPLLISWPSAC